MRGLSLVFLILCSVLWALGSFNLVSTKHIDIFYDDGLELSAYKLYQEADRIFERLVSEFERPPRTRPRVYLLKSDLSNGYADPLNNVIVIYVSDMDPYQFTPNYEDWAVFCFTHELAHLFLANQFSPHIEWLSVFGHSVAAAIQSVLTPLYLHEGVAILQESREGVGRANDTLFELYRRNALATDIGLRYASSINTTRFTPGGASYTLGYTLLRSLEKKEKGSVSKLIDEFSRNPFLTFGKHLTKFASVEEIRSWLSGKVHVEGKRLSELSLIPSKLNIELWRVYYAFKGYDSPSAIYFYDIFEGKSHKLVEVSNIVSFAVNSKRDLAIVRRIMKDGRYVNRLYLWKNSLFETRMDHIMDVAWLDDDNLALIVQENDVRKIALFNVRTSSVGEVRIPKGLIPLQIAANKDCIVFTAKENRNIEIYMVQGGLLKRITNDGKLKISPVIVNNTLFFVGEENGELKAFKMDLLTNQIYETGTKGCIAAVVWEGEVFSIEPVPNGYALFSQVEAETRKGSIEFTLFAESVRAIQPPKLAPKKSYDVMRFRFALPLPYVDPTEKDFGAGVVLGFWDDLVDNIATVALLKTTKSSWIASTFRSSQGLTLSLAAEREYLAFDLSVSSHNYRDLRNGRFVSSVGLTFEPKGVYPSLSLGYAYGSVGGPIHLQNFADFSFAIGLLPNMFFEFSKAFAFKQLLFEVRGSFEFSGANFSTQVVLPAIRTNLGSFDGFLALDSFGLSMGIQQGTERIYWARIDFNAHVSYQVPLRPYVKFGLKDEKFFIHFGFEDVLSGLLRLEKDHDIISTVR